VSPASGFPLKQTWRLRKKSNICVTHDFSEFHVRQVRCILRNRASLDLELFTKPSDRDFLRGHQNFLWAGKGTASSTI